MCTIQSLLDILAQVATIFQEVHATMTTVLHPTIHVQADGRSLEQPVIMGTMPHVTPIITVRLEVH
jgi:hypothetical protein